MVVTSHHLCQYPSSIRGIQKFSTSEFQRIILSILFFVFSLKIQGQIIIIVYRAAIDIKNFKNRTEERIQKYFCCYNFLC